MDSACNKSCTGEIWLKHYLKALKSAPQEIRALVKSVPEQEVFRFGNGGCKTSFTRYRLPMMLGTSLLTFWVSVVDVPSLGLLLGRDFLDAVGAVLSFARKRMRADHLDGSLVKLRQIAAGYFALCLLPPRWSLPGALRWRKVGQDSVVEVQVSSKDWLSRKLEAQAISQKAVYEHLFTEQGMLAADVSHSGLAVQFEPIAPLSLAHEAQASRSPCAFVSTTTSSTTSSSWSSAHAPRRMSSWERGKGGSKMEPNAYAPTKTRSVARTWCALVAAATAISAIFAGALPQCNQGGPVDFASSADGGFSCLAQEMDCKEQVSWSLRNEQPQRAGRVSKSIGYEVKLSGRSPSSRDAGSSPSQRCSKRYEASCNGRCQEASGRGSRSWPHERGYPNLDRTSRRAPITQERSSPLSRAASDPSDRKDDGRGTQDPLQAHHTRPQDGHETSVIHWTEQQPRTNGGRLKPQNSSNKPDFSSNQQYGNPCYAMWTGDFGGGPISDSSTRSKISSHVQSSDAAHHTYEHKYPGSAPGIQHGHASGRYSSGHLGRRHSRARPGRVRGEFRRLVLHVPWREEKKIGRNEQLALNNPWRIHQEVKPGLSTQIAQAWEKHKRDRRAVSSSTKEVHDAMEVASEKEMESCLNEVFVASVNLSSQPLMQEIFTTAQRVTQEAGKLGHRVGEPLSLETGWDFMKSLDRKAAYKLIEKTKPYFLVVAYPCGPWSPLMRLRPAANLEQIRQEHRVLIQFALKLARLQKKNHCHFILENPIGSASWNLPEVVKFLEEEEARLAKFDQCRFNLRSEAGMLHKKGTQMATSSEAVHRRLDGVRCLVRWRFGGEVGWNQNFPGSQTGCEAIAWKHCSSFKQEIG